MSFLIIFIYYVFLYLYYKFKLKKIFIFIIILLIINQIIPKFDNNYYVSFLDVSQGDSAIIITPHKENVIMIDTGGLINSDYKVSNNSITFLKSLGINKIDYLILSHGDYDHLGEAINVINNINVKKVIFNHNEYNELELSIIELLDKKKIKYTNKIDNLEIDKINFNFLNNLIYDNENDNSSVIYIEINYFKFLFMGDAGVNVEQDILKQYNLKNIDVLKVGHHGSKSSSSVFFLNQIQPIYSVISVGKNNLYGHPHSSVLEGLKNSKIYRTDNDGSVIFKIKNKEMNIKTCMP